MIQSDTLAQDAVDYLNKIEEAKLAESAAKGRIGAREELLNWCNQWYTTAQTWRKASFETDWLGFQRNADGRYDQNLASQKQPWQSKSFVDLTPTHRETIHAELFRLRAGSDIIDVSARSGSDPEQAKNIKDLEKREFEKSRLLVEYDKGVQDKTTYGSAFYRLWFETKYEDRVIQVPIQEPLNSPQAIMRSIMGRRATVGYQGQVQKVLTYRGVRIRHYSIWDIFPDPKALGIKGHAHLIRAFITLQEIMDRVKAGEFMAECAAAMSQEASNEDTPADKSPLQTERGITDDSPKREGNQKSWEYYEIFARLPQKWVFPLLSTPVEVVEPDALIPARIIFHKKAIFAVELNTDYEGEAPLLKDDYFPVAGRYYARGIPEMLKNAQNVINEVVNQRLDEGNLALQEGFAVIEKALTNPQDLIKGGPGLILRFDAKKMGPDGDVSKAIFPLGRPDVKINAGFTEVHEWERFAEGRTSANRVVVGNADRFQGANRTLGGQQLLKQTAGEKFAFIEMRSEYDFWHELFMSYWKLIYSNIQPQDVVDALGADRASRFQLMSPEEISRAYKFQPKGIFEQTAKAERQARLSALHEQFKGLPGLNDMAFFDAEAEAMDIAPDRLKFPQSQQMYLDGKAQQIALPMAKQMLAEIVIGQAVKQVEKNMAEHLAEQAEGEKEKTEKPEKK
jgi:hypothetical protein